MKNLFRPLLVLTGCIVLASCVSQKQFKGLKTDYTKLQTVRRWPYVYEYVQ